MTTLNVVQHSAISFESSEKLIESLSYQSSVVIPSIADCFRNPISADNATYINLICHKLNLILTTVNNLFYQANKSSSLNQFLLCFLRRWVLMKIDRKSSPKFSSMLISRHRKSITAHFLNINCFRLAVVKYFSTDGSIIRMFMRLGFWNFPLAGASLWLWSSMTLRKRKQIVVEKPVTIVNSNIETGNIA